ARPEPVEWSGSGSEPQDRHLPPDLRQRRKGARPRRAERRPERHRRSRRAAEEPARQGIQAMSTPRQAAELRLLQGRGGLVARGVGKTYKKRPVVRNVSIRLRRGEAVGLLGPNGAGKTTTFYMIVG